MGYYADWTPQDVAVKADWEGGVQGLLDWGGPDAFEGLGEYAYAIAKRIGSDFRELQELLSNVDMEGYEEE